MGFLQIQGFAMNLYEYIHGNDKMVCCFSPQNLKSDQKSVFCFYGNFYIHFFFLRCDNFEDLGHDAASMSLAIGLHYVFQTLVTWCDSLMIIWRYSRETAFVMIDGSMYLLQLRQVSLGNNAEDIDAWIHILKAWMYNISAALWVHGRKYKRFWLWLIEI